MEKAARILKSHGVESEDIAFPSKHSDAEALKMMHNKVFAAKTQLAFLKDYRTDKTKLGPEIRDLLKKKSHFTREETMEALDQYATVRPIFHKLASRFSTIVTPSAVDEAPLGLDDMGNSAFNFLWTVGTTYLIYCPF